MSNDTIYYWVQPEIRPQFASAISAVWPDAKPVEYAHESDMGGANVTTDALHRYFDRLGDINPAAFIVDRETGSAHDPFDADQAKVRAWTSHVSDLMQVAYIRLAGVPAAASLMCMLPANASFASPTRWREAVRRQAALGMWDYGGAHHFQLFTDNANTGGAWMTDDFDRCRAKIEMGILPPWPVYCQWCPATREGRNNAPGKMHARSVLSRNIEHTLRSGVARPQLWWPGKDANAPEVRYMLSELASLAGRSVPDGGGVG